MDIRDKLLETVNPNDPNFKVLLHNAIKDEISHLQEELSAKRAYNERRKLQLKATLERRQYLKKSIKEKTELCELLEPAVKCLQDYHLQLIEELTLTKNNLDKDYLLEMSHIEKEEKMVDDLEQKCLEYEAEFEKDPLAQKRKAARQELLKVEVDIKIAEASVRDMKRNFAIHAEIQKKKEQQQIIALAELCLNYRKHCEENKHLKQQEAEWKAEVAEQERQIQAFIKEKTDKEKSNAMARYLMPPPVMDKKIVETIFLTQTEKNVPESMIDSLNDNASISSSIYEEMCANPQKVTLSTTEIEQIVSEPDVVSLASSFDSRSMRENSFNSESTEKMQNVDTMPIKKNENFAVKKKPEQTVSKKMETPKRSTNLQRINPLHKKSRNDLNLKNAPKEHKTPEQSSVKLSAVKKVKKSSQSQERGSSVADAIVPEKRRNNERRDVAERRDVSERREVAERRDVSERRDAAERRDAVERSGISEKIGFPERREVSEIRAFSEDSFTMENADQMGNEGPSEGDLDFENRSISESVNSFSFGGNNVNETGANAELLSDVSFQSNLDNLDRNNSIVFSSDELTNTENNADNGNETDIVPAAEPSAPVSFGFFGTQNNKRALNFQGLFFK